MKDVCGFLKAEGRKLVNGEGREILLRGVGLGNWLLQEGYMWLFPEMGDRSRRIEHMIKELIGEEKSNEFWDTYYDSYISEGDIRRISEEGFNSIRLPINSRFLINIDEPLNLNEKHLQLLDRFIGWCKKYSLYVILDLHGAPGGQTGTNIDDSVNNKPELFTSESNRELTINIWRKLAERYRDEWIIAGYDLLNEPLPEWFSKYNGEVMPLYKKIIKNIREVDDRHLIILEGVHWATDWSIFNEKIDDNIMLEFHKYWNNPDIESIKAYLKKREELNVPIFMGEGGENNKNWYAGAFKLFEQMNISWNFWTWKKMNTTNSPFSIKTPVKWNMLVDFLKGGSKPSNNESIDILWEYLSNIEFNNSIYMPEVVNSIFSRIPVSIPAIFYDYHGEGLSYGIIQKKNNHLEFRAGDGTDIGFVNGTTNRVNFHHGSGEDWQDDERLYVKLNAGDWAAYGIESLKDTQYIIELHVFAPNGNGVILAAVDETEVESVNVKSGLWNTVMIDSKIRIKPGKHKITLKVSGNPIALEWLRVAPKGAINLGWC